MSQTTRTTPYWWQAIGPPALSMVPVPQRCDVAIVGAGYTGLSAALTLARAGRSVHVFDRQRPGEGASTRNGGIASGNLRASFSELVERLGIERATAFYLEGKAAREDLAEFIKAEGISCDYQLVGRFTGASRPEHYEQLAREAALMREHLNIDAEPVPASEVYREVATDRYFGGIVQPDIAGLHPAKLHAGLLALARSAGAVVHGETGVSRVRRDGDYLNLRTLRGPVRARDVIVATNGYADRSDPWLRRRLVPVASRIIATEPLPAELMAELIPNRRMLGETARLYHYYRPAPDGSRILFGGRAPDPKDDPMAGTGELRHDLATLFPALQGVGLSHSWFGYVAFNRDSMPRLFTRDGVRYAAGFCGSGVVWARWLGVKAALQVLGDERAASQFFFRPPRAIPLYAGKPWFMPMVTAWMRFRDRLGADRARAGRGGGGD